MTDRPFTSPFDQQRHRQPGCSILDPRYGRADRPQHQHCRDPSPRRHLRRHRRARWNSLLRRARKLPRLAQLPRLDDAVQRQSHLQRQERRLLRLGHHPLHRPRIDGPLLRRQLAVSHRYEIQQLPGPGRRREQARHPRPQRAAGRPDHALGPGDEGSADDRRRHARSDAARRARVVHQYRRHRSATHSILANSEDGKLYVGTRTPTASRRDADQASAKRICRRWPGWNGLRGQQRSSSPS